LLYTAYAVGHICLEFYIHLPLLSVIFWLNISPNQNPNTKSYNKERIFADKRNILFLFPLKRCLNILRYITLSVGRITVKEVKRIWKEPTLSSRQDTTQHFPSVTEESHEKASVTIKRVKPKVEIGTCKVLTSYLCTEP